MTTRISMLTSALIVSAGMMWFATATAAQSKAPAKSYTPSKMGWGDPNLQGTYTDKDGNGIPLERPGQFEGKRAEDVDDSELADIIKERQQRALAGAAAIGARAARLIHSKTGACTISASHAVWSDRCCRSSTATRSRSCRRRVT